MRKLFTFLVLALAVVATQAQTQQISFLSNPNLINPAYAGSHGGSMVNLSYNQQWGGVKDAPTTQIANVSSRLGKNVGMAGTIYQHSKGPMNINSLNVAYAYHLQMGEKANLALGLHANFSIYNFDESQLIFENPNDPAITGGVKKSIAPDAAAGAYFYTDKLHFGVAAYQLFQNEISFSNVVADSIAQSGAMAIFVTTGAKLAMGESLQLEPTALIRQAANLPLFFDAGVNVLLKEQLKLGASFRSTQTVLAKVGFVRNNSLSVAYAYGYSLSEVSSYIQGSHEVAIAYLF